MKLATGTTIITNGQLVDGNGEPPIPNAAVIVTESLFGNCSVGAACL
jgi:hypothetical protein